MEENQGQNTINHCVSLIEVMTNQVDKFHEVKMSWIYKKSPSVDANEKSKTTTDLDKVLPNINLLEFAFSIFVNLNWNAFFYVLYLLSKYGIPNNKAVLLVFLFLALHVLHLFLSIKSLIQSFVNKKLTSFYKLATLFIILILIFLFFVVIRTEVRSGEYSKIIIGENDEILLYPWMQILVFIFVGLPMCFLAPKLIIALLGWIQFLFSWAIKLPVTFSIREYSDFLEKSIQFGDNSTKRLWDLEKDSIDILINWSKSRRETIKNRSEIFTFLLAINGIFSALRKESILQLFNFTNVQSVRGTILASMLFTFFMILILLKIHLWYESFKTDFINEVCTIVLYGKE